MSPPQVAAPDTRPLARLVKDIVRLWTGGQEPADTHAALKEHPELAAEAEYVADLAALEYQQRTRNGEPLNPKAFSERFPGCQSAVFNMIMAHDLLADNPGFTQGDLEWPDAGDAWMSFELVRRLGKGAFARVYLAREPALGNRLVALKIAKFGGGTEAETLGRLSHENIVPVYSIREDVVKGLTATAMPYLGEATLDDVLEFAFSGDGPPARAQVILEAAQLRPGEEAVHPRGQPSPILTRGTYVDGVLHLGLQLADALAFAHERDIYHRDLKPSNVLVRPDGKPMLLDFNLSFNPHVEETYIGGTPLYMSPELLLATDKNYTGSCLVGAPSDLYSLGVMLYEMLSGNHPFRRVSWPGPEEGRRQRLADAQRAGPTLLRELNPRLDKRVAGVVERCLAYEPQRRFASAAELAVALRRCLSPPQRLRRRVARHPRAMFATVVAGLALTTALAAGLLIRDPYQEREFKNGTQAYEQGRYPQAVAHFSRALTHQDSARVRLARGRAYQKLGEHHSALQDFLLADKLDPTGQTKACLAYCYNEMDNDELAAARYQDAISKGFRTAVVFNNLGYSLMMLPRGTAPQAAENLRKAIKADPRLQSAHYNLAVLVLQRGFNSFTRVSAADVKEGLEAMNAALSLGPTSATLHLQAAHLFTLGAKVEPRWQEFVLEELAKGIDQGLPPGNLKEDPIFKRLRQDARFQRLLARPAVQPGRPAIPIRRILDPLEHKMALLAN